MRRCKKYGEYNRRARSKCETNMMCCASSSPQHYECFVVIEAEGKSQDATIDEEPSIITAYD